MLIKQASKQNKQKYNITTQTTSNNNHRTTATTTTATNSVQAPSVFQRHLVPLRNLWTSGGGETRPREEGGGGRRTEVGNGRRR